MQPKHRTPPVSAAHFVLADPTPLLLLRRRLRLDPARHHLNAAAGVDRFGVALVSTDGLLVGTGDVRRHRLCSIPFTGA